MIEHTQGNSALLRLALRVNAAFSFATGGAMVALPERLETWTGVPSSLLFWAGLVVVVNAVPMTLHSLRPAMPRAQTLGFIAGDVLWVVASIVVLAWRPWDLSTAGLAFIADVALIVAAFAIAQSVGIRRMRVVTT